MSYPGGKAGAGVYQTIINQLPPHDLYVEPFLGGGAILRKKAPAAWSVGIDLNPRVCAGWQDWAGERSSRLGVEHRLIECRDGIGFLEELVWKPGARVLIYCDPPYLPSSRRTDGPLYDHELDEEQHVRLLRAVLALAAGDRSTPPAMVAISSYPNLLYSKHLADWRLLEFQAATRGATATEQLWMSYPEPDELHDYQYLGDGYRERERIQRKRARWVRMWQAMPVLERRALLAALNEVDEATRAAQG